jgi:divalent metal cation (Fe/Co/Zn/Cd) transporter
VTGVQTCALPICLPAATEQEILNILTHSKEVTEPHHLRTRRIGATVAIEAHIRVDPRMSVLRSHQLTVDIERRLKERFGPNTLISIHVEPIETEKLSSSAPEKDKNI